MPTTVFFSWQSDRPGRNFIEKALQSAIDRISQDVKLDEPERNKLILDRDTKNVPGSPSIFETLLRKIANAAIFVADVTFVGKSIDGDLLPNPNVLLEYGYALRALGDNRIIAVMNTAHGKPSELPFDLTAKRYPEGYDLPDDASDETRTKVRQSLSKALEGHLRLILESEEYLASIPKPPAPTAGIYREPLDGRARFRAEGQPLGFNRPAIAHLTGAKAGKIFLDDGPAMWLRVGPQKPIEPPMKVTDLETIVQGIAVLPLYEASAPPSLIWNSDGAGWARAFDAKPSPSTAFMFTDGEIWTINTLFFKFYPDLIFLQEEHYAETLKQCAVHLDRIGIKGPYRFVAGIEGIEGLYLPAPHSNVRGAGPCTVNIVEEPGIFKIGDDTANALEPFFAEVFDKCRARRPIRPARSI